MNDRAECGATRSILCTLYIILHLLLVLLRSPVEQRSHAACNISVDSLAFRSFASFNLYVLAYLS